MTKTLRFSWSPGISLNFVFPVWHVHRDANQSLLSAAHLIDFRVRKKVKLELTVTIIPVYNVLNTLLHHSNSKEGCVCNKEMDSVYTCSLFSRLHIIFFLLLIVWVDGSSLVPT